MIKFPTAWAAPDILPALLKVTYQQITCALSANVAPSLDLFASNNCINVGELYILEYKTGHRIKKFTCGQGLLFCKFKSLEII
jgi:hypothetical protein